MDEKVIELLSIVYVNKGWSLESYEEQARTIEKKYALAV